MVQSLNFPQLTRQQWAALGFVALILAISVMVRPVNRDEGQYVAATALIGSGWPYRDFPYLQTPLQPFLLSPLSALPAGWLLVGSRIANALFALGAVLLIGLACRRHVSAGIVAIAMVAMVCSDPFLYASALARNDALPTLMLAGAVALLVSAADSHRTRARPYFLAGLLLGLAASTKISFALPAAGAGLFLLLTGHRRHWLSLAFFALGGIAGIIPSLAMAVLEPQRFFFDVFTYSLTAPQQWWTAIGRADALTPEHKIQRLMELASHGTILAALLIVLVDRRRGELCLLLDLMIVGGLVGAYLPEPSFEQYLAPVVPPLYVRLALALEHRRGAFRMVALPLLAFGALCGLFLTSKFSYKTLTQQWQLGDAVRQGRITAELAAGGRVVSISPERVVGSDVAFDRGFVTGPFLFRTEGALSDQAWRLASSPNWQRLGRYLDQHPPAAILTGGEATARPPLHWRGLDAYLIDWARMRSYRPVPIPGPGFMLYLRPPPGGLRIGDSVAF